MIRSGLAFAMHLRHARHFAMPGSTCGVKRYPVTVWFRRVRFWKTEILKISRSLVCYYNHGIIVLQLTPPSQVICLFGVILLTCTANKEECSCGQLTWQATLIQTASWTWLIFYQVKVLQPSRMVSVWAVRGYACILCKIASQISSNARLGGKPCQVTRSFQHRCCPITGRLTAEQAMC